MLHHLTKRRLLIFLLGLLTVLALVLLGRRLNASKIGGQQPAEPFRIAGNFYYVGANDIAAFLITGPEGHVVIDGGYPTTAPIAPIVMIGITTGLGLVAAIGSAIFFRLVARRQTSAVAGPNA